MTTTMTTTVRTEPHLRHTPQAQRFRTQSDGGGEVARKHQPGILQLLLGIAGLVPRAIRLSSRFAVGAVAFIGVGSVMISTIVFVVVVASASVLFLRHCSPTLSVAAFR